MKYIAAVLITLLPLFSCASSTSKGKGPEYYCGKISYITELPQKQHVGYQDEIYTKLIEHGFASTPCLIEAITDSTQMQNPISSPGQPRILAVGDIAFFVWWRISGAEVQDIWPRYVVEDYQTHGISAYFDYVQIPGNRRHLQENLRRWHSKESTRF
jgi:hypothetical protein